MPANKIVADLHIHSTFSDGLFTPEQLVEKAIEENLSAIAIADHDNYQAIDPAIEAAEDRLQIIPAIEFSSEIDGKDLHILGYFIDYNCPELVKEVDRYRKVRDSRAEKMVEKLIQNGLDLSYSEVLDLADGASVGRPHIGRILIEKGYVSSMGEAFQKFIGEHCPAYVRKYKIHPFDAFKLIRKAGGLPVWAHPGRMDIDHYFEKFVENGMMGVEVYHPKHDRRDQDRYYNLAQRHNLYITGGTDFHGADLGAPIGTYGINKEQLNKLLSFDSAKIS